MRFAVAAIEAWSVTSSGMALASVHPLAASSPLAMSARTHKNGEPVGRQVLRDLEPDTLVGPVIRATRLSGMILSFCPALRNREFFAP